MWHIDFTCGATNNTETVTLVNGSGNTDLVDTSDDTKSETADEPLTIICGTGVSNQNITSYREPEFARTLTSPA